MGPGSFTSNLQNPVIANSGTVSTGVYTLAVNNGGCIETRTTQAIVYPIPTITVNSGTICLGNSFTINPLGASTYTFQGGNMVVSPTTNTSYTVIGTSSAGCVSSSFATSYISLDTPPTITVNSGTICSGSSFTINPNGANTYSIQGGNTVVTPTASTSYTVMGFSTLGCVSAVSATANITVNTTPTIYVNNGVMCYGNSFTIHPSGAANYTIQGGNSVVSPTANTSYSILGSSLEGCLSSNTATCSITVNLLPIVNAISSADSSFICAGESITLTATGALSYSWYPAGTGANITINPMATTNYTVVGLDTNGCSNTATVSLNVSECIGLNEGTMQNVQMEVYPNPASDILHLKFRNLNSDTLKIEIYNSIGQLVLIPNVFYNKVPITLTGLENGFYTLRVIVSDKVILDRKFIKN